MTTERIDILNEIIRDLLGTCQILDAVAHEHGIDDLTTEDLLFIETEIFCCSNCGWWCEVCEAHDDNGDTLCDDCYED